MIFPSYISTIWWNNASSLPCFFVSERILINLLALCNGSTGDRLIPRLRIPIFLLEPSQNLPPRHVIQRNYVIPKRGRIHLMTYNLSDNVIHIHSRLKLGCLSPARPASVNLVQSQANTAYSSVSGISQSSAIPGKYSLL